MTITKEDINFKSKTYYHVTIERYSKAYKRTPIGR